MSTLIVGVDPGLTTGLFAVEHLGRAMTSEPIAVQVNGPHGVLPVVRGLVADTDCAEILLAVEAFVVGRRAGASATPQAGAAARALIASLSDYAIELCREPYRIGRTHTRTAAQVKPWATDKRLAAAGLADACKGMPHARDAARHALFAAVHTGLLRDPLAGKAVGE